MDSGTLRYVHTASAVQHRTNAADSPQKGMIIKWSILGGFFLFFMLWFFGGYIHAKRRLKAGKPLLKYHRVSPPRSATPRHPPLTDKPAVPHRLERAQTLRPNPPEPLHLLRDAEPVPAAARRALPAAAGRLVARAAPHVQRHRRAAPVLCAAAPRRDQDEPQPAGRPADGDAAVRSAAAAAHGRAPGPPAERRRRQRERGCRAGPGAAAAAAAEREDHVAGVYREV